jgi:hypothetical protein
MINFLPGYYLLLHHALCSVTTLGPVKASPEWSFANLWLLSWVKQAQQATKRRQKSRTSIPAEARTTKDSQESQGATRAEGPNTQNSEL